MHKPLKTFRIFAAQKIYYRYVECPGQNILLDIDPKVSVCAACSETVPWPYLVSVHYVRKIIL